MGPYKAISDQAYWREQYRNEADENYRIRQALGVDPSDPDETLTVRMVNKKLREEYKRGYEDGKRHNQRFLVERLKHILETSEDLRADVQALLTL